MSKVIDNISKLCTKIAIISEPEFAEVTKMAEDQINHSHPLKMGTAAKINEIGKKNMEIIEYMRKIKKAVNEIAEISKKKVIKY
jgi:hypothetical protein